MSYHNNLSRKLKKCHFLTQKHQNIVLFIVVTNKNVKPNNKNLFSFRLDLHL